MTTCSVDLATTALVVLRDRVIREVFLVEATFSVGLAVGSLRVLRGLSTFVVCFVDIAEVVFLVLRVVVIGCMRAGLFAALVLCGLEAGFILVEEFVVVAVAAGIAKATVLPTWRVPILYKIC